MLIASVTVVQSCDRLGRSRPILRSRRAWLAAAAATAGGLGAAWYLRPQSVDREAFVLACLQEMDDLFNSTPDWALSEASSVEPIFPLLDQVSRPLTLVGSMDRGSNSLASSVQAWKLVGPGGNLFVLDMSMRRAVRGLSSHLEVIRRSSGDLSIAAMQLDAQVLVAAVTGSIHAFVAPTQFA